MAASSENQYPWKQPAKPVKRGAFIVIEGLDRAGKTTQVKKLCDTLYSAGHNLTTIRFPDRTSPIGKMIDNYLQSKTKMDDHAIHLLFSANRWEKAKWIEETLSSGYNIVCDRYYYSGMIYSAAKNNPLLSLEWARTCDVGLPAPDIVIFLDLEPEEAQKRGGFGKEKYEKREMQLRVRELFLGLKNNIDGRNMKVIDAGATVDVVGEKVLKEAEWVLDMIGKGDFDGKVSKVSP